MEDDSHGKRDEVAFRGETLGRAKTRAEQIGFTQREAFATIVRTLKSLEMDGIQVGPSQITFEDPVDQAAWERYNAPAPSTELVPHDPWQPPFMDTEDELVERTRE